MPAAPVPPEVEEFLRQPSPAVVATLREDGSPHTAATWYDWEDGRILMNVESTRLRLANMRRDPRVTLTVLGEESWYRQVTLFGRIVSIEEDPELEEIDRLARRYTGQPFRSRDQHRVSVWMEVDRWYGWDGGRPWPPKT